MGMSEGEYGSTLFTHLTVEIQRRGGHFGSPGGTARQAKCGTHRNVTTPGSRSSSEKYRSPPLPELHKGVLPTRVHVDPHHRLHPWSHGRQREWWCDSVESGWCKNPIPTRSVGAGEADHQCRVEHLAKVWGSVTGEVWGSVTWKVWGSETGKVWGSVTWVEIDM